MRTKFDIFISHAASDRDLADALRTVVCDSLGLDTNRVFISSDGKSIRLGDKGEKQITKAHQDARAVIALMTPQSIFRPWVIYESGGANFNVAKPLFVVLANGATVDCLPAPLKDWQAGYLKDRRCIENLCETLRTALRLRLREGRLRKKQIENLIAMASSGSGDWESVSVALVAEKAARSPFNIQNLLTDDGKSGQSAKRAVYLIGQNLNFLTRHPNTADIKSRIFGWLKKDASRRMRVMVCDIKNRATVKAWKAIFGADYERHLNHSTRVFARWNTEAKREGLAFEARATEFVPITAAFLDPEDDAGFMVLTPITYKPISGERPHFIVGRRQHKAVFDYYWYAYWEQFADKSRLIR